MNKAFELWQWENAPSAETPLSAEFLNRLNNGLNEVDNRVINQNTTKLDVTTANTMVKDVTFDSASGIFTVIKLNGSTVKIDTKLEKLAVNFEFDSSTQTLNIILEDGTTQTVDLSTLITQYEFGESDTIVLTVGSDGKVVANIKFGSITGNMLEPNYLANVTTQADSAKVSAETATTQADRATTEADRAEAAADRAESIAGGDFATNTKVDAIIDGTTIVGNADKLDGHEAEYFATTADLANYLPLSGGMVGNGNLMEALKTKGTTEAFHGFYDKNNGTLGFIGFDSNKKLMYKDASLANKEILHTGNKPSGTYTGNGDATRRTIEIGGIGTVVHIGNQLNFAVVSSNGYIGRLNSQVVTGTDVYTSATGIVMETTSALFNTSGLTYTYQKL